MHYFNICSKKTIQTPEGEKNIFHKTGVIKVTENGGWFLQLFQHPHTDFHIFPKNDEQLPVIR